MKAISLFSGVGGFDLGFERAGIETVLQAEQDPHCLAVLERHWPHVRRVNDVRTVGLGLGQRHIESQPKHIEADKPDSARTRNVGDVLREAHGVDEQRQAGTKGGGTAGRHIAELHGDGIDLIYGGFPCQDLSVAGKRAGLGGERSGLWFEFHRVLRELRPRWCVIENVPGLLSSNSGRDFAVLLDGLGELGFDVAWAVLDAQHFGVPQRRRRVFIVGGPSRRAAEQVLSVCESCGGNPETRGAAGERLADTLAVGANQTSGFKGDIVEALAVRTANTGANGHGVAGDVAHTLDGANGKAVLASAVQASAAKKGTRGDGSDNLVLAHAVKSNTGHTHREDAETYVADVAYTIAAREAKGVSTLESQTNYVAKSGVRRLTPLECERLQGFPDNWTAGQADSHRYRQMGNAVCVPVAEWIGHRLVAVDAS